MIKVSRRDRMVLAAGGTVLLIFFVFQLGIFPLLDKRSQLRRGIETREEALVQMRDLQARYRELHGKANALLDQLGSREANFSLFSFLEQMAAKSEIKQNIAYMRPSTTAGEGPFRETLVEMKLQEVTLKQLVDFLILVEAPEKIVALKRISIQENTQRKGALDVIMQVVSLDRSTEGA
ncbi:MAG: type II secretion system protein GspM [Desulfobulbaceae bacterium]|jgi:general secretion pathway protein M|nr:type II secretion system protein GspM [Desulfobulbaceae bacterium]MDY0350872.1 type II secretion system protein GspM [Desulfobulbaceae bacterium]